MKKAFLQDMLILIALQLFVQLWRTAQKGVFRKGAGFLTIADEALVTIGEKPGDAFYAAPPIFGCSVVRI
jgi:hypothetical protein